jgi:uncharacterized membrane protein YdjX (TVP38/TMEM64 family)
MKAMTDGEPRPAKWRISAWRFLPLVVLAAGAIFFFALGLDDYLTFEALKNNRQRLLALIADDAVLAALLFMAVYAAGIVFLPPSGTVMTLAGGFVFGAAAATLYVVAAATIGATALFLAARLSLGEMLHQRAGPAVRKMEAGFHKSEMSYMLVLRLVPLFPFWLVNLAPAFLDVRLRTFVIGTFFGIIPGTAVYAYVGSGLGSIFETSESFSISAVMTPEIVAGLTALALLALVPVAYKKIKGGEL